MIFGLQIRMLINFDTNKISQAKAEESFRQNSSPA